MKIWRIITLLMIGATVSVASNSCVQVAKDLVDKGVTASGPVVRQERRIGSINELSVSTGLNVKYVQSDSMKVVVEAPQNVIDLIATKESDGELSIYLTKQVKSRGSSINIVVMAPKVVDFDASAGASLTIADGYTAGGGEVEIDASSGASFSAGTIVAASVDVECSSGSSASISGINATSVEAGSSSGSSLSLAGKAVNADLSVSSGGSLNASHLSAEAGKASASSGGSLTSNIRVASISQNSGGSVRNN